MSFIATPVNAEDVRPGQAFSTEGPDYWTRDRDPEALGERVYLRTTAACPPRDVGLDVWIITWRGKPTSCRTCGAEQRDHQGRGHDFVDWAVTS